MRPALLATLSLLLFSVSLPSQIETQPGSEPPFSHGGPPKFPDGRDRTPAILKADHEKTLEDARRLVELSQSLEKELEQSGAFVMGMSQLKKAEEIEKLAKRIRSRIKR